MLRTILSFDHYAEAYFAYVPRRPYDTKCQILVQLNNQINRTYPNIQWRHKLKRATAAVKIPEK